MLTGALIIFAFLLLCALNWLNQVLNYDEDDE